MSFNKVLLIGNVGKEPEIRHLESGTSVASFTLATTERFKDKSGAVQDQTEWHNIVCWRNLAELTEKYINKGSQIFIEGKIRTRSWTDQSGQKRYTTEIIADNIRLLGKRGDMASAAPSYGGSSNGSASGTSSNPYQGSSYSAMGQANIPEEDGADDLPF